MDTWELHTCLKLTNNLFNLLVTILMGNFTNQPSTLLLPSHPLSKGPLTKSLPLKHQISSHIVQIVKSKFFCTLF